MHDESRENIDPKQQIDKQIDDVSKALKLTQAFSAELHEADGSGADYVRGMVERLEERLRSLNALRSARFGEMD